MKLLPIDEINTLSDEIKKHPRVYREDELFDTILGVLILSYKNGVDDANDMIDSEEIYDFGKLMDSLNKEYDGKTWEDRVKEYFKSRDGESIARVIETESHRNYNQAIMDTGEASGKDIRKTWKTMMDDKVRESHFYLEGMEVGLNENFYTFDGDFGRFPGDFKEASNNVGCRCAISLSES